MSKLFHSTGWSIWLRPDGVDVLMDGDAAAERATLLESGLMYDEAMDVACEIAQIREQPNGKLWRLQVAARQ